MPASTVLVRIPMVVSRWAMASPLCPPIGLAYLAGSMRQAGLPVRCVDALGEDPFKHTLLEDPNFMTYGLTVPEIAQKVGRADIIGVSVIFSNGWPVAKRIVRALRAANPEALIVLGGEHVTAVPEFCLTDCPEADVCVRGEGEETLVELVKAHCEGRDLSEVAGLALRKGGVPARTAERGRIRALDAIPWPAWELVPLETYLCNELGFGINPGRTVPMLATRGCPYQCTFCSNPNMWTTRWQARSAQEVLKEIGHYMEKFGARNIDFYDLTAVVKRDWLVEFCNGIIERGWKITWQMPAGTRSEALDEEVLNLMLRSGVNHLTYAPESGSELSLKMIKKRIGLKKMVGSMRAAVRAGIKVKMNLIFGFPHETPRDILDSFAFIKDVAVIGVHDLIINSFMPYPGSELFNQLHQEGKVRDSGTGRVISALDEAYFFSLANELSSSDSYAPAISNRQLSLFKVAGLSWFYGLSFLFRPWRLARVLLNFLQRKEETRLDASLGQLRDRLVSRKRRPPP